MKIVFSSKATDELFAIREYFKDVGRDKYGKTLTRKIVEKASSLKSFPNLGKVDETMNEYGFEHRFLIEGNYKILYRVQGDEIRIVKVFDTRQDPEKMTE